MHSPGPILVIAATTRELANGEGWRSLSCGVGPVEAAAATAAAIAALHPAAILHVGIAGARRGANLTPPALVIGLASHYCDLSPLSAWAPRAVSASPMLLAALCRAFPAVATRVIGTSARVGGTAERHSNTNDETGALIDVEAMEGFGVLRAAALAGVPAIEVRAISNLIDEPDRSRWQLAEAFAAITAVTPMLAAAVQSVIQDATREGRRVTDA